MPLRREQVAAALRAVGNKADLRRRFERATSLDPQEQDLADIAVETGASMLPFVGQTVIGPALAMRDVERARRADDPAGMAMASMGAIPGGRLAGLLKRYDPVMQQLDVYHGTPHKFPATETNPLGEFDASKIGTGEGAQAYGHGVYLAESPGVATEYKNKLGKVVSSIDNKPTSDVYEEWAVSALKNFSEPEKAKAYFQNLVDVGLLQGKKGNEIKSYVDSVNSAIDRAAGKQVGQTIGGSLYKADLPDEMIDRMLDWDKPLSEQPAAVRKAIDRIEGEFGMRQQPYKNQEATGFWYGALTDTVGGQQNASKLLKEYGVPGIKYADAGSRGQGGSGTRNFVVFPGEEKKVRILERK